MATVGMHSESVENGLVRVPGLVDYHTHILRDALGGRPRFMYGDIGDFHREVKARNQTPMDYPPEPIRTKEIGRRIFRSLMQAREAGLTEVWEAGLDQLECLYELLSIREYDLLPLRVRILIASGLAERTMPSMTGDLGVEIAGVKFYVDGWLGYRTCAVSRPFLNSNETGILFMEAETLAKRAGPFADRGFAIATHAIGDRAIEVALDAYEMIYGGDCRSAQPRIEHGMLLRRDLIARIADLGVKVCVQPSFRGSDEQHIRSSLGNRWPYAYDWATASSCGVGLLSGSDSPLEQLNGVASLYVLARQLGSIGMSGSLAAGADVTTGTTLLSGPLALNEEEPRVVSTYPVM